MGYFTNNKFERKFDLDFNGKDFKNLKECLNEVLTVSGVAIIKPKSGLSKGKLKSVWEFENYSDSLFFGNTILDEWAQNILNGEKSEEICCAIREGKFKIKVEQATSKNGSMYYRIKEID